MNTIGYGQVEKCAEGGLVRPSATVSENIDRQIAEMQKQIERLEQLKKLLSEPGGILNVPIQDLRFAMNY